MRHLRWRSHPCMKGRLRCITRRHQTPRALSLCKFAAAGDICGKPARRLMDAFDEATRRAMPCHAMPCHAICHMPYAICHMPCMPYAMSKPGGFQLFETLHTGSTRLLGWGQRRHLSAVGSPPGELGCLCRDVPCSQCGLQTQHDQLLQLFRAFKGVMRPAHVSGESSHIRLCLILPCESFCPRCIMARTLPRGRRPVLQSCREKAGQGISMPHRDMPCASPHLPLL